MAFNIPPFSREIVIIVLIIIIAIGLFTMPKRYSVIDVKIGEDGKPGNPTGQQALDYRNNQQPQEPFTTYSGSNLPYSNAWSHL